MFFPNSLYYLLVGTWRAVAVAAVLVMVAWVLHDPIARALRQRAPRLPASLTRVSRGTSFLVVHSFLLFFALVLFEDRAATLSPANRHLLLERSSGAMLPTGDGRPLEGPAQVRTGEGRGSADFTAAHATRYFLLDRLTAKTQRVNEELVQDEEATSGPDGKGEITRKHYGLSVALLVLLVILLAVERLYWRSPPSFRPLELIVRPVLYVLALTLVVTLPAAYGVLWMPKGATWVEIATAPAEPPITGYLLTDISSDEPDVWTVTLADTTFTMRVFKRESISEIRLTGNSTSNLLAVVREPPRSPQPPEGIARADAANE